MNIFKKVFGIPKRLALLEKKMKELELSNNLMRAALLSVQRTSAPELSSNKETPPETETTRKPAGKPNKNPTARHLTRDDIININALLPNDEFGPKEVHDIAELLKVNHKQVYYYIRTSNKFEKIKRGTYKKKY